MGKPIPRIVDQPQPGFFRIRIVRKGPYVSARLVQQDGIWSAFINGKLVAQPDPDWVRAGVEKIWAFGVSITPAEYQKLRGSVEDSDARKPFDPMTHPVSF